MCIYMNIYDYWTENFRLHISVLVLSICIANKKNNYACTYIYIRVREYK